MYNFIMRFRDISDASEFMSCLENLIDCFQKVKSTEDQDALLKDLVEYLNYFKGPSEE